MLMVNQLSGFGSAVYASPPLAGLQAWYRSDLGITKDGSNLVATWADQSGNGRNLTEATNKPLWVASLVNGHPALRFDGTNDLLTTAAFSVSQPFTCFLVMKTVSNTNGDRAMAFGTDAASPNLVQRAGPLLQVQSDSLDGASVSVDTTSFHYFKALFNGTSSVISIDGGADATDADNLATGLTLVVAGSDGFGDFANVEIAEFFLYNSSISGSVLTGVNSYLSIRYGL